MQKAFFVEDRDWALGQCDEEIKYYPRPKDPRPGCRWRAAIKCKEHDPKLLAKGQRLPIVHVVSKYGATKQEARAAIIAFKHELELRYPSGKAANEGRARTVAEIVNTYWEHDIAKHLPKRTAQTYKSIRNHIVNKLGTVPESKLCPTLIEDALLEYHRKRSKEAIGFLRRALNQANKDREGYTNPCDGCDPVFMKNRKPKAEWKRHIGEVTPAQKTKLYETIDALPATWRFGDALQWRCFFFLLSWAGPRIGELLKVKIADYDRSNHTLWVASKTPAGKRHLVLGSKGVELIEAQIAALDARGYDGVLRTIDGKPQIVKYLFPALLGGDYAYKNFDDNVYGPLLLRAGLAHEVLKGKPCLYDKSRERKHDGIVPDFTPLWFRHAAETREQLGQAAPGRPDLPIDPTPGIYVDLMQGHENDQRQFNRAAVTLPYTNPNNPCGFDARRPYAERGDAIEASYLPAPPSEPTEARKPKRHLSAVPSRAA